MAKHPAWTGELRRAQKEGARIVCAVAPYEGREMSYQPRRKGDPKPWVIKGMEDRQPYRWNGRECKAVGKSGGPWVLARLLKV